MSKLNRSARQATVPLGTRPPDPTPGVAAVLMIRTRYAAKFAGTATSTLANPLEDRVGQVMTVLTIALAAVNALMTAWATVLGARRSSALSRALGVTPGQVTAGLAAAQMLPALRARCWVHMIEE